MSKKNTYFIRLFWSEEDDCFVAEVPELKNCVGFGATEESALREAQKAILQWIKVAKQMGKPIPEPITHQGAARLNLRLPADIIQHLKRNAREMGISLNQFILRKLSQASY